MKARCWFEEEPRADFIRNIAPWDADDLDADRSRGLRLDSECVFRTIVTGQSGIVTGDFGIVTERSGIVTEGCQEGFEGCV